LKSGFRPVEECEWVSVLVSADSAASSIGFLTWNVALAMS
jgi:hypothetical protein